ncbi:MAG TPA: ATP-binding cassette domain-containing protein [Steroidobacteraceae bacterium]|nr:ATP-binding cassette domain-containing protein [Steroidobacteraceae bacterium]
MLALRNVTLRRGPRALFTDASLSLYAGEKVGIVGPNGAGKSSLFALLLGELSADTGEVSVQAGRVLASVAQEVPPDSRAAVEFVLDGDRELRAVEQQVREATEAHDGTRLGLLHGRLEALGGYTARSHAARLLAGLGFKTSDIERPVAEFSGGWRRRLALAQALMSRADVLLLDEPTNHLDLDAVLWLEEWLRAYPGTLLVIAHDREFLDRVVTRIVSIEGERVVTYAGNYSDFEAQRTLRLAQLQSAFERQQREIRHVLDFVQRFKAKASKARQAQSRLRLLERMERIAPAHVDSPFEFGFQAPLRLPRPLLTLEDASAGYAGRVVLAGLSLSLSPGDRIGLLGRNGAGKSTLTRTLAGIQPLQTGQRIAAQDLAVGYFAQHQLEQLDPRASPLAHLRAEGGADLARATEEQQRTFLGGFGFTGARVFEPVAPFSGGEKARLVLALIVSRRPNLLLLDEPTNHLDLEMRHALGMALQDYSGAIVLVSHDRYLLRLVTDQLWLVAEGAARPFDGDLDDYAAWLRASAGRAAPGAGGERGAAAQKGRRRVEAERRQRLSPLRADLARLDAELERLTAAAADVEARLTAAELYAPAAREDLARALAIQAELKRSLAATEEAWLEASEQLTRASRAE